MIGQGIVEVISKSAFAILFLEFLFFLKDGLRSLQSEVFVDQALSVNLLVTLANRLLHMLDYESAPKSQDVP